LITIDLGELKNKRVELSKFLQSKIRASISVKRNKLLLNPERKDVSPKEVKTLVKRFLHRKALSETYRVTEEQRVIRITKRRRGKKRSAEKKKVPPSAYDTLPYYFPLRP